MKPAEIAIIVLNWNGLADTLECIDSLKRLDYSDYEIIVSDNGSTDNSLPVLREAHPEIIYLDNKENLGFAEGNNRAIRYALDKGYDTLFILNNDTTVSEHCLGELVAAARELPEESVLGCQIRYYSDPETIWHFGARWDMRKLKLQEIARDQLATEWNRVEPVDQVIGCAMFVPARVMEKVGLFDARFFLNFEETDWCFRAKTQGVSLYSVPRAVVYHKISASFASSAHGAYYLGRNRLLWIEKNFPAGTRLRIYLRHDLKRLLVILVRLPMQVVLAPVLRCMSAKRYRDNNVQMADNFARLVGIYDYLRRHFGPCPDFIRKLPGG